MSAQRVRSAVAADHRSIHPGLPGLPWWGAVAVAVAATAVGFAFDAGSGNKELTGVYATLYVLGCVAAVLAVRQSGLFTAVIQPPLILFCSVPGSYWLLHGATFTGIKGIVINCGYPLIERFPLMLFTSVGVLLIGMIRWYLGMVTHSTAAKTDDGATTRPRRPTLTDKIGAMIAATLNRDPAHAIDTTTSGERRTDSRARRTTDAARRSGRRTTASTRSRRFRPAADEAADLRERPRRRRSTPDQGEAPPPRRRPRPPQDSAGNGQPAPRDRRDRYSRADRPIPRDNRTESYQPAEPSQSLPRRRQEPSPTNGHTSRFSATHHPVSQVRYRKTDSGNESREAREAGPGSQNRSDDDASSWRYDI
ncbi:MAG: DUF6542 domain-containing protein [Mycobacterium sp.]